MDEFAEKTLSKIEEKDQPQIIAPTLNTNAKTLQNLLTLLLSGEDKDFNINIQSVLTPEFPLTNTAVLTLYLISHLKGNHLGLSSIYLPIFIKSSDETRELLASKNALLNSNNKFSTFNAFDDIENAYFEILTKKLENAVYTTKQNALKKIMTLIKENPSFKEHPRLIKLLNVLKI